MARVQLRSKGPAVITAAYDALVHDQMRYAEERNLETTQLVPPCFKQKFKAKYVFEPVASSIDDAIRSAEAAIATHADAGVDHAAVLKRRREEDLSFDMQGGCARTQDNGGS